MDTAEQRVGRLAPTPSGAIHLGNALSFAAAWLSARSSGTELLLRIEDVDRSRARRHVEDAQKRDLDWLGLLWDREVLPQRDRDYAPFLSMLGDAVYVCGCTRSELKRAGGVHPLECRDRRAASGARRFALADRTVTFYDRVHGARHIRPLDFGDPVLRRRDDVYTYNLAVVADDLMDGVTEVVRGADLLDYTAVQIELWEAFGATPPSWAHIPLILGSDGRKLSKSHHASGVDELRDAGVSAAAIRRQLARWLGQSEDVFERPAFVPERVPTAPIRLPENIRSLLIS